MAPISLILGIHPHQQPMGPANGTPAKLSLGYPILAWAMYNLCLSLVLSLLAVWTSCILCRHLVSWMHPSDLCCNFFALFGFDSCCCWLNILNWTSDNFDFCFWGFFHFFLSGNVDGPCYQQLVPSTVVRPCEVWPVLVSPCSWLTFP